MFSNNVVGTSVEHATSRNYVDAVVLELVDAVDQLAVEMEQIASARGHQLAAVDMIEQVAQVAELVSGYTHPQRPVERLAVLVDAQHPARLNAVVADEADAVALARRQLHSAQLGRLETVVEAIVSQTSARARQLSEAPLLGWSGMLVAVAAPERGLRLRPSHERRAQR